MNDLNFLVSVTISEFEILHNLGSFQLEPSRLIVVPSTANNGYGREVDAQILAKLPGFISSEEHTVVILGFTNLGTGHDGVVEPLSAPLSGRVVLSARDCSQVLPLTSRARSILSGRLQGRVILGQPLFEDLIEGHLNRLENSTSFVGAEAILEALVANYKDFPQKQLRRVMRQKERGMGELLHSMLKFTRYNPMPREPISGLRDLGGILKNSVHGERMEILKELSGWLKPKQDSVSGFLKVYGAPELCDLMDRVTRAWDLPVSAASLAVFFYWRDLALQAGGIDMDALSEDCDELAGCLDGQMVAAALWLFGFSAGFESIAIGCYKRMGEEHPFNPTHASGRRIVLCALPETPPNESEKPQLAPSDDTTSKIGESGKSGDKKPEDAKKTAKKAGRKTPKKRATKKAATKAAKKDAGKEAKRNSKDSSEGDLFSSNDPS